MQKFKILLLIISLFFLNLAAYADSQASSESGMDASSIGMVGSMTSSTAEQAGQQEAAKYIGTATSVVLGWQFSKECPASGVSCAMAALSFAGAALSLMSAEEDNKTCDDITGLDCKPPKVTTTCIPRPNFPCDGDDTGGGGPGNNGDDDDGPDDDTTTYTSNDLNEIIKSHLEDLGGMGYEYDSGDGTIKMPGGKKVSAKSLGTPKGLSDATGIPLSEAQEIFADAANRSKKIASNAKITRMGFANTGGYTGSKSRSRSGSRDPFGQNGRGKGKRKPASVVGMAKKTQGGDRIGVKGDNIFHIIHRAYKQMRSDGYFLAPNYKPKR